MKKKFCSFLLANLIGLVAIESKAQTKLVDLYEPFRDLPSFSLSLSDEFCTKEFPIHRKTEIQLKAQNAPITFSLFSFTTKPYDQNLESILVINGGPGGLDNLSRAKTITEQLAGFNVVFFHIRGGGCSAFKNNSITVDKEIDSMSVVNDMESIRKTYGVSQWKSVLGFSYGTNIARLYANLHSSAVESIVLEGLDSLSAKALRDAKEKSEIGMSNTLDLESQSVLEKIRARYTQSPNVRQYFQGSELNSKIMSGTAVSDYLKFLSVRRNYFLLGFWSSYKPILEEHFHSRSQEMPKHFNKATFGAITFLAYSPLSEASDSAVIVVLSQIYDVELPHEIAEQFYKFFSEDIAFFFYPFLNPNYVSSFSKSGGMSERVRQSVVANDSSLTYKDFCSNVKTLVINGSADAATPVENVDAYLVDKTCATNQQNASLIVEGGGHSSFSSLACLSRASIQFINGSDTSNLSVALKDCKSSVSLRTYDQ